MYLFKFALTLISVGGAGYALLKANEAPFWVKFVAVTLAISSFIVSLAELPKAIDAVENTLPKLAKILPSEETARGIANGASLKLSVA
jgi:hypothetical protein